MKEKVTILIEKNGISYLFAKISVAADGSLEIAFPEIKDNTGISQTLQIAGQNISLISNDIVPQKDEPHYYISYHTSGRVNYHKMSFQSAFMEPLNDVREQNIFFVYSFVHPEIAFKNPNNKSHDNPVSIDISSLEGIRINIVLSVCPPEFQLQHNNGFVINYPLYSLYVEVVADEATFGFSRIYQESDCVKLRPHLDKFSEQCMTKEEAFLAYHHALYQTNEAIVLSPNGEGVLKIIFTVEMRRAPWVYIEFINKDYCAKIITRKTTHLTFRVFDHKHNRYIKNAEDIQITQLILDAEIYPDESVISPEYI